MKRKMIIVLVFINTLFGSSLFAQDNKDTLYIESVDPNRLSIVRINCEEFDASFAGKIKYKVIVDKDTIARLVYFLNKVKYPRKDRGIDVRAKFIYKKGDAADVVICTSGFYISVNNRLIKDNSKFAALLRSLAFRD